MVHGLLSIIHENERILAPWLSCNSGRVISVYVLVYAGGMPLGNLLAGGLTTLFGAPIALLIGGIPCFVAALVGWMMRKPAEKNLAASTTAMSIE
jgi:MFS family permease